MIQFKAMCFICDELYYGWTHNQDTVVLNIRNYNKNLCNNQNVLNKIMYELHFLDLPFFAGKTCFKESEFSN